MWSMFMVTPKGIDIGTYKQVQEKRAGEDFKYSTAQSLNSIKDDVTHLQSDLLDVKHELSSDIKECHIEIQNMQKDMLEKLKSFKEQVDAVNKSHELVRDEIKTLRQVLDNKIDEDDFENSCIAIDSSVDVVKKDQEKVREEFNSLLERQTITFDAKLKQQKDDIISRPSDVPDLKHLMNQKLELVELNGQNAVLRSSNNERQLQLFERKLDQIYQQMKNLDLKIQESK